MAVQKWMDYKLIITNGRLKEIAIGTWLSESFPAAAYFSMAVVSGNRTVLKGVLTGWVATEAVCLFLIAFFYRKVYLAIRNRKLDEISQIHVLMKAKLESKVAKTTGLLNRCDNILVHPTICFCCIRNFRTNASIRLTH